MSEPVRAARVPARFGISAVSTVYCALAWANLLFTSTGDVQEDDRTWLPPPVEELTIRDATGELLGHPTRIFGITDNGILVVDIADNTLIALSPTGTPRWRFGRRGEGPGEFDIIVDVDVTEDGRILALDRELRRITILDSDGEQRGEVALPRVAASELLPGLGTGTLALVEVDPLDDDGRTGLTRSWWTIAEDGQRGAPLDIPVSCGHFLTCETIATGAGSAGGVIAFRWASTLMLLDPSGSVRAVVDGVEPMEFPDVVSDEIDPEAAGIPGFSTLVVTKVEPEATEATAQVSANDSLTLVLALGGTDVRQRGVDVYLTADGAYLGSVLLPETVADIALLTDGRLATLETALIPQTTLWQLQL